MAAETDSRTVVKSHVSNGGRGALGYGLLYRLGLTPWDQNIVPPELKELVEGSNALRPGNALDLGCGGGRLSIYLAERGWDVTGVDFAMQPLEIAGARAAMAGVNVKWVQGDVARLEELKLGNRFGLILDAGCLHGLRGTERAGFADGVNAAAAAQAHMLLLCFKPAFRGPAPRGLSREEICVTFEPEWELLWDKPAAEMHLPGPLRSASPRWYCLRRS